jgi:baculoviral IAP repeat-containing protein 7/8
VWFVRTTSSISEMFPFSMLTFNLLSWISSKLRGIQEQHDLRFETARLSTFRNWPLSCSIDPARLAAAGFFYTGISTTVKCFVCKVEISQWTKYSIPVLIHKMYCPECPLVRHEHRGNVPIKSRSYLRPRRVSKLANLKYLTYESRLNTFVAWPNTYIRSEKLADAGFYYNGINDMVICHHCGIAIDNWSRGEDPCNRHATSSPGCCYIIKGRSCECINNVTGQDLHETFVEVSRKTYTLNHMYNCKDVGGIRKYK